MWIFTQHGYVSIVQHFTPTPGAELLVRARSSEHLRKVLGLVLPADRVTELIRPTPDHDYPWRAAVDRSVVRDLVVASVDALDYPNYKHRAAETLGWHDAQVLGDIWAITHDFNYVKKGVRQGVSSREKNDRLTWEWSWKEQRRLMARWDESFWKDVADARSRPVPSPRPLNLRQTLKSFLDPPKLEHTDEPWERRPGSAGPPSEEALHADRIRCRRIWGHFERTRQRLGVKSVTGHAPVAALDTDGSPAALATSVMRPLRFRAVLHPGSLAAMRVTRHFKEQGCGGSWQTTLIGSRLVWSVAAGHTPHMEFWIAPCRRPGLEGHHEIVNTVLTGWDYKSPVCFDSSDFDIAERCVAGLNFAMNGPRGHYMQANSEVPLEPLLEADGIDPGSPEGKVGVRHWWVADRGDDGFPYFDIDGATDEELLNA